MKKQKIYIQKIILMVFIFIIYFGYTFIVNAGAVANSQAKVCRDVACEDPEIINFNISEGNPLVIDIEKGLSGKVWGGELGWITFNPPYGGVFFTDSVTGLLKGTAWSETSGAINFSVTGQKVVIDPKTGEWNGWAWAMGPYGGWVKFDCSDASSCVKTGEGQSSFNYTQVEKEEGSTSFSSDRVSYFRRFVTGASALIATWTLNVQVAMESIFNSFSYSLITLFDGIKLFITSTYNSLSYSFANLYSGTGYLIVDTSGSIYTSFANLFNGTGYYISSTSNSISYSFANLYSGTGYLIVDTSGSIYTSFANLFNGTGYYISSTSNSILSSFANLYNKTGNLAVGVYNSVYLYSINYKASVIGAVDSLFK
ncbi:MAG: hypothetical protein WC577_00055 [Candidatus Paceibacterota bacterium]